MIFYFSGTGNSYYAARQIAQYHGETLYSIAHEMRRTEDTLNYTLNENELLGFVFPVYAWGPPRMVLDFIQRLKLNKLQLPYTFSVATCGDEEGYATRMLLKALNKKGLVLNSGYTLIMPNNYILGFDVDQEAVKEEKLARAEQSLQEINAYIEKRQQMYFPLKEGTHPFLKSRVINPLFNRFALRTDGFYATEACIECGLCQKVCCANTITCKGRPTWGKSCTQCLACIHRCPVKAIEYGKRTKGKGRYLHPILKEGSAQHPL